MFDDQQKPANPPQNLPVEPADMFAGVDKEDATPAPKMPDALSSGLLKKKEPIMSVGATAPTPAMPSMTAMPLSNEKQPILGKIVIALAIALVLGGTVFAVVLWRKRVAEQAPVVAAPPVEEKAVPPVVETPNITEPSAPTEAQPAAAEAPTSSVTTRINNDSILFGNLVDTDKDGLDDIREKEIGTNPNQVDTDNDLLTDGDEVIIWKTDPLNPDTDGDKFPDGTEVKNGYRPDGPGKLTNPPAAATSTSSTSTP